MELKAILFGLKSLCKDYSRVHIRLRSDNTTAVACIDRCCSTKVSLNSVVEDIFVWAELRQITLLAQYIKGLDNVVAYSASRVKNSDGEWMLKSSIFRLLCRAFYTPEIDLFACLNICLGNLILLLSVLMLLQLTGLMRTSMPFHPSGS